MIDGVSDVRIRRYINRCDEPSVPQVLGRFGMDPAAEPAVRGLIDGKSPEAGGDEGSPPGEDLYRRVSAPPFEGGEGVPSGCLCRRKNPLPPFRGGGYNPLVNGSRQIRGVRPSTEVTQ